MKKLATAAIVVVGIGIVAGRLGAKCRNMDWEKVFEAMPDNAPPKWMFRNITAIRENTERIIELLEGSATDAGPQAHSTTPE
jgi:hypothetical protein